MASIAANLKRVRESIDAAARNCGRDPSEIQLVAVSKTFPPEIVAEAFRAGQAVFGENRVQEAVRKAAHPDLKGASWHLIGHLQTNKANKAARTFQMVETVDSDRLAIKLSAAATSAQREISVLAQINVGDEPQKTGANIDDAAALVSLIEEQPNLKLEGLMTIPPYTQQAEASRPYFRTLRELLRRINAERSTPLTQLSMGMSHDFPVAIEEGATIVRVGTAIFGSRA